MKIKRIFSILSLAAILSMNAISSPTVVNAQDLVTPQTTTTENRGFDFEWWMLLPLVLLLAVPFLFRKSDEDKTRKGVGSEAAYHDIDRYEENIENNENSDEGRGWHDDSKHHADAARGKKVH